MPGDRHAPYDLLKHLPDAIRRQARLRADPCPNACAVQQTEAYDVDRLSRRWHGTFTMRRSRCIIGGATQVTRRQSLASALGLTSRRNP